MEFTLTATTLFLSAGTKRRRSESGDVGPVGEIVSVHDSKITTAGNRADHKEGNRGYIVDSAGANDADAASSPRIDSADNTVDAKELTSNTDSASESPHDDIDNCLVERMEVVHDTAPVVAGEMNLPDNSNVDHSSRGNGDEQVIIEDYEVDSDIVDQAATYNRREDYPGTGRTRLSRLRRHGQMFLTLAYTYLLSTLDDDDDNDDDGDDDDDGDE
jgi:hypothetical protein